MGTNRFGGECATCGNYVLEGCGVSYKENGRWLTAHNFGDPACKPPEPSNPFDHITLDEFQQKVRDSLVLGVRGPHLMVCARAGSGKSTVQQKSVWDMLELDPSLSVLMAAFGAEDGSRIKANKASTVDGCTIHSLCWRLLRQAFPGIKMNKRKDNDLVEEFIPDDEDNGSQRDMREYVLAMLEKIKAEAIRPGDTAAMLGLVDEYNLDIPRVDQKYAVYWANKLLKEGMDLEKWGVSFNDQIYLVVIKNIPLPVFDVVAIDEVQDLNVCQLIILSRLVELGARVAAVGDPNQSLYMFRGAKPDSFWRVQRMLQATDRGCDTFEMPICYRQSRAIIEHACKLVPGLQARPDAPQGSVDLNFPASKLLEVLKPGDCVLSRTNRPLVALTHTLGTLGIEFYMRGGEKEAGWLCWLVNLLATEKGPETDDAPELLKRLADWLKQCQERCRPMKYIEFASKAEVIQMLGKRCETVTELKKAIKKLYKKPKNLDECIVVSTIHLAKGSEAENIYHIEPELCPHPLAETEDELVQEEHAEYVAITRGKISYNECAA